METGKHDKERCREIFALLSEYLDQELSAQSCAEIEAHLAGCPPCIEFLSSLKQTVRLCQECEEQEKPRPLGAAEREKLLDAYRSFVAAKRAGSE
jgi:anti-sigma factor (TIGR02949 family)